MTDMGERKHHSEMHKRQRSKNLALMAVLFGLAVLFYLVSIVQMGRTP